MTKEQKNCCHKEDGKKDYLFITTFAVILISLALYFLNIDFGIDLIKQFCASSYELMSKMWWGVLLGIIFVGIIGLVPKEAVIKILGKPNGLNGILRAAFAGILLDLCSHGILLVGMKLYERGASLPQVMAFLIASPWNSFSLTLILWALIGFKWMISFVFLSFAIAIISGLAISFFVKKDVLPNNPHYKEFDEKKTFQELFKEEYKNKELTPKFFFKTFIKAQKESEMVLRWIFVGVIIASLIRVSVPTEIFAHYFGASLLGLGMTIVAATIIEVCSEGSVPIAADIFSRALAPGNAFVFLMTGVSTDYTEVLVLKETTKSWKSALFLPLVTVPQVILIGYILNHFSP